MSKTLEIIKKGLITKNPLFITGLVLSAAIFTSDSLKTALITAICFTIITAVTAAIINILPLAKTPYTVRIILYILIASCVYLPSQMLVTAIFPAETAKIVTYLGCICVNSLILERFDKRNLKKKSQKVLFIFSMILSFDISLLVFAVIREIISYGTVYGVLVGLDSPMPVFGYVFGGLILLGVFAGIYRYILIETGVYDH